MILPFLSVCRMNGSDDRSKASKSCDDRAGSEAKTLSTLTRNTLTSSFDAASSLAVLISDSQIWHPSVWKIMIFSFPRSFLRFIFLDEERLPFIYSPSTLIDEILVPGAAFESRSSKISAKPTTLRLSSPVVHTSSRSRIYSSSTQASPSLNSSPS